MIRLAVLGQFGDDIAVTERRILRACAIIVVLIVFGSLTTLISGLTLQALRQVPFISEK